MKDKNQPQVWNRCSLLCPSSVQVFVSHHSPPYMIRSSSQRSVETGVQDRPQPGEFIYLELSWIWLADGMRESGDIDCDWFRSEWIKRKGKQENADPAAYLYSTSCS